MAKKSHDIVVVGGGAAGITVAAILKRKDASLNVAVIEPSDTHYYQPALTLVGGGAFDIAKVHRTEASVMPKGVEWIKDYAAAFDPENNEVILQSGDVLSYEQLVVCPGLRLDWNKIEGLEDTIGENGVCSNYLPQYASYTWECVKKLQIGDVALFTQPQMPIKCAGAPQKIAYLTADRLKQRGLLNDVTLRFFTPLAAMFGVPYFSKELDKVVKRYGIDPNFKHELIGIDGKNKVARFQTTDNDDKREIEVSFDMIHVTPPQSAPQFIQDSPLANDAGWVDVNQHTLQHQRFNNIFSLGDIASTPNAKTAAAVRKQAPVVVNNLMALRASGSLLSEYDGYGSCPLTTALDKVILAEFTYGGKVTPTLPLEPSKERYSMWLLKKYGLPIMYWGYMLKGMTWDMHHDTHYPKKIEQRLAHGTK